MRTVIRGVGRVINELIALGAIVAIMVAKGSAQETSPTVYFGEVDSKTDKSITLNVTPCQNTKTLHQISPYKITGSGQASCSGGKQYTRVTVQESKANPKPPDPNPNGPLDDTADKKNDGDVKPKPER